MNRCYIFLIILLLSNQLSAQHSDKAIIEICKCVNNIKKKLPENQKIELASMCLTTTVRTNLDSLKKEFGVTTPGPIEATETVSLKMSDIMDEKCPQLSRYLIKAGAAIVREKYQKGDNDVNTDTLTLNRQVCKLFQSEKFKIIESYFNNKIVKDEEGVDTTRSYYEIKDNIVYDYNDNEVHITKWEVRYINECEWDHIFLESNSATINASFKKGEILHYKAIGSVGDELWVTTNIMGLDFVFVYQKLPK